MSVEKWGWAAVVGSGCVCVTAASLVLAQIWPKDAGDVASWVQAIGSIVAILAATWIASSQQRAANRKERLAELRVVQSTCRLGVEALALVVDVRGLRTGGVSWDDFVARKQREAVRISETLNGLPPHLMLADGVLHSVFQIRIQLGHLGMLLEASAKAGNLFHQFDPLGQVEQEIRDRVDELKAILVRHWHFKAAD